MRNVICITFLALFLFSCDTKPKEKAQRNKIVCEGCFSADEAALKIGQNIKVVGMVSEVKYVHWESGQPTFINLDQSFPNIKFNVVVFGENKLKFGNLESLSGKRIIVKGKVEKYGYKGNDQYKATEYPQITVTEASQIEVLE